MGSIFFVLIQYLLAKAAGVSSGLLPAKELELPEVEKNFFDQNYYAQRSIGLLKKSFETFFGTTPRSIFFRSSAYLFLAALACLAMLLVKYVGSAGLLKLVRNGFAIQLQPDEYDRFRSAFGSTFDRMLTPDHFAHVGYPIFVTAAFFVFAYAVLSACTAVFIVGLYNFISWFSGSDRISAASVAFRLARLLTLAIVANLVFLLVSFGVPVLLGQVAGIRPYQVPNVQPFQRPEGEVRMLVYRLGIIIRQPDRPYIRYAFGLGLGPLSVSDISKQGIPRPYLEEHLSEVELLTSTEAFCREAGLSDRRECIRRLVDLSFDRFKDVPADFWRGALGDISSRASQAVCLNTDVVPSDFPPTVRFAFTLYMPFLITTLFEGVLGALIVPILLCLYLLNRLVVRIGRRQIMRSEFGLSLLAKYGSSFLALPVLLLLAVLQIARNVYCSG